MKLIIARTAGFCFGVRRAVRICDKAAREHPGCVTLGPIIHNDSVIMDLKHKGVCAISDISVVRSGDVVIIRSHGEGKATYDKLNALGAVIIDATCPDVRKIHNIVREEYDKGRLPVIIGQRSHSEVIAIAGWCEENEVFETPEELKCWLKTGDNAGKPISVVFQTTNTRDVFNSCVETVKKVCTNQIIFDTICNVTSQRQQEATAISKTADIMVVVGGRNSANSLRLKDICKQYCSRVIFAESAQDFECTDIRVSDTIGVTGGASTPAWIIKEVISKMSEEIILDRTADEQDTPETITKTEDITEINTGDSTAAVDLSDESKVSDEAAEETSVIVESEAVESEKVESEEVKPQVVESVVVESEEAANETVREEEPAQQETKDEPIEQTEPSEDDSETIVPETFEEMLEKSIKTLHTGEKVSGVITSITATEVSVDLGTKQSGYIPINEFTDDNDSNINDIIKIGDTIESFVMRVNDVEGMVTLSKKRLDAIKNWDEIEAAKENNTIVEGVVTEENRGGIVVSVKGVNVFVPASLSGLPKNTPITELLKKKVKLRITEVNQSRRRVVGSIRAVQVEERREKAERVWNEIETGKQYDGIVKSMTSYGVFVDIGGVDGMIHISELSWKRIRQPSEVMSVGDEVSVYVLSFDKENKKISLGYKKSEDNPWAKFTSQYAVGDVVNVKIVKMMTFGAFAEICPGVDGLIHISQITDHRIGLPSEVLSDGQMVDVKITEIDENRKKVSLSIKAILVPSSQPLTEAEIEQARTMDKTPHVVYDTDAPPPTDDETVSDTADLTADEIVAEPEVEPEAEIEAETKAAVPEIEVDNAVEADTEAGDVQETPVTVDNPEAWTVADTMQ